jgi:hypothetical protein
MKLFDAVKKGIDGIKFVQKILKAIDKLDDDTDGDGKSQLQNICEEAELTLGHVIAEGKSVQRDIASLVNVVKADAARIVKLVGDLADHVLKEK